MNLCACGCGQQTRIDSDTYIRGHFIRECPHECGFTAKSSKSMGLHVRRMHLSPKRHYHRCECGCGKFTRIESEQYLPGHWEASQKQYQHGTVMCYRLKRCRCDKCCHAKLHSNRENALKVRYGMTWSDLEAVITKQCGRCPICLSTLGDYGMPAGRGKGGGGNVHIDHDHSTNLFRGVLCRSCNQGLGKFKDNPDALIRASWYIRSGGSSTEEIK